MTQNQGEAGIGQSVAPWRDRASSGMRLSVPPPLPARARSGAKSNLDADWDDEKEDAATDVYVERATLELKKDGMGDDESTHEIPRPTLRRLPSPSSPPSPPSGFDKLSASLAAASLAPPGFTAALARTNELANAASTPPPPLGIPSQRIGWGLTAAAVVALVVFGHKQGTIVVDATDTHGAPVRHLEILVDGEKTPCEEAPCSVPSSKGLHEVKISAAGFGAPAVQAVAVASGDSTPAHFIVASAIEPGIGESDLKVTASHDAVKPASDSNATAPVSTPTPATAPAEAAPVPVVALAPLPALEPAPTPVATPRLPSRPAPAPPAAPEEPAAKASPARSVAGAGPAGYLNINSIPASTCFLDGRSLGSTPRLSVEVSAGSHTVKFRAPDGSSTKTLLVKVGAGETRLAVARLK